VGDETLIGRDLSGPSLEIDCSEDNELMKAKSDPFCSGEEE
jgi:hypothetical protein